MPTSSDPTDALRAHFRAEREDEHPPGEQLAAYHERRLPSKEAEAVRRHLAACPDCAGQLLDLAALLEAEEAPSPVLSGPEIDAAWQRQRARRFGPSPVVPLARRQAAPSWRRAWGIAACLALALGGGAVLWFRPGPTISRAGAPRVHGPTLELDPIGATRGNKPPLPKLEFTAGEEGRRVILNSRMRPSAFGYEAQLVAPDDRVLQIFSALAANEAGHVHLDVPRDAIPPGSHRIRIRLSAPSGHEEYELQIDNPPAGR